MASAGAVFRIPLITGENSDAPTDSGPMLALETKGLVPLLPAGDTRGGLQTLPGWRLYGQDTFAAVPTVHGEPGTASATTVGTVASTATSSQWYGKVRVVSVTPPDFGGSVIALYYCGKGQSDSKAGQCLGIAHENWGGFVRAGEVSEVYYEEPTEDDIDTVTLASFAIADIPSGFEGSPGILDYLGLFGDWAAVTPAAVTAASDLTAAWTVGVYHYVQGSALPAAANGAGAFAATSGSNDATYPWYFRIDWDTDDNSLYTDGQVIVLRVIATNATNGLTIDKSATFEWYDPDLSSMVPHTMSYTQNANQNFGWRENGPPPVPVLERKLYISSNTTRPENNTAFSLLLIDDPAGGYPLENVGNLSGGAKLAAGSYYFWIGIVTSYGEVYGGPTAFTVT